MQPEPCFRKCVNSPSENHLNIFERFKYQKNHADIMVLLVFEMFKILI